MSVVKASGTLDVEKWKDKEDTQKKKWISALERSSLAPSKTAINVSFEVRLLPSSLEPRGFWVKLVLHLLNYLERWHCAAVLRTFWQHATIRFSIPTGGQIIACTGGWTWTIIWLQSRSPIRGHIYRLLLLCDHTTKFKYAKYSENNIHIKNTYIKGNVSSYIFFKV